LASLISFTTCDVVAPRAELGFLAPQARSILVSGSHALALGTRCAEAVEDVALGRHREQRLRLVLTVQVHEYPAQRRQRGYGGGAPVGPGSVSARRIDLAPHDEPILFHVHPELVGRCLDAAETGHVERGLDHGAWRSRTHEVRAGALSQQEREGIHQHGLAGSGLAGQYVEARSEWKRDVRDDRQVSNAELSQHC
jgi:hypothetical protein